MTRISPVSLVHLIALNQMYQECPFLMLKDL